MPISNKINQFRLSLKQLAIWGKGTTFCSKGRRGLRDVGWQPTDPVKAFSMNSLLLVLIIVGLGTDYL